MEHLNSLAEHLVTNSVSLSTRKSYYTGLLKFESFRSIYCLSQAWPTPAHDLLLFISYCTHQGLSASSISTYMSGISHKHKMQGLPDPCSVFLVRKALEGLRRIQGGQPQDLRAPITLPLLCNLINSLSHVCYSAYEQSLFAATFSLAFFGLLRVGEFTSPNSKSESNKLLLVSDVKLSHNMIYLRIRWSKTDQHGSSVTLQIAGTSGIYCRVHNLAQYLVKRPQSSCKNLFVHFNTRPLTRFQSISVLQKALQFINAPGHFRSHSFRIGGATYLQSRGSQMIRSRSWGGGNLGSMHATSDYPHNLCT